MDELVNALKEISDNSLANDRALLKLTEVVIERLLEVEKKYDDVRHIMGNVEQKLEALIKELNG